MPRILRQIGRVGGRADRARSGHALSAGQPRHAQRAISSWKHLAEAARRARTRRRPGGDPRSGQGAGRRNEERLGNEDVYERFKDAAKALREAIDEVQPQMQFDAAAARPAAETGPASGRLGRDLAGQYEQKNASWACSISTTC